MEKIKKMLPYLLVIAICFYLLPFFMKDTGSAMLMLLGVIPCLCLITSVLYGARNSFNIGYPLLVAILFFPTIFIFYNSSAWVYTIGYGAIALIGNAIGMLLQRR